jgi:hypothetical protein
MTLLTHFRNKKYAVVACDQKLSDPDKKVIYDDRSKILVSKDKTLIIANYSQIIFEIIDYQSLASEHDVKNIKETFDKVIVHRKNKSASILIVDSNETTLLSKQYPEQEIWDFKVNSSTKVAYNELKFETNHRAIIEKLCENQVFFNEVIHEDISFILHTHNDFYQTFLSCYKECSMKDFDIIHFEKERIRKALKLFYSKIYTIQKFSEKIGGNVDVVILDIEKGKINPEDEFVISNDEIQQQIDEWKMEFTLNDIIEFQ